MDLDKLKKDLFYRNGKFSLIQTCCLGCVFIFVLVAVIGTIAPDTNTDTNVKDQLSAYDRIPDEFKNTEDYQILEFGNSICAVDSIYDLISNETNEKNFTYPFDECNLNGVYLSIKELDDDSLDINPSDLNEPRYRYVESENLNFANTPVKKVSFTDTHGETTNENWEDYNIYTFDKNGKHYQITSYGWDAALEVELEKIIESFTKK